MIPLVNKQTHIKFNYSHPTDSATASKIHQFKKEVFYNHEAIRQSQLNKYVVETFSSLNIQTKKSLPSEIIIHTRDRKIPNRKENLLQMPETCKSLLKVEELNSQIQAQTQQQQSQIGKWNKPNHQAKFKIDQIQQIKQTDFDQLFNKNKQHVGSKNKKVIKNNFNFQSIQDATNSFFEPNANSTLNQPGQSKVVTSNINHGKRGSRQIKAFKIENIQERKQSDFGGCCGFGITNKIAFLSKDD